jgi:hypothetical protein
MNKTPRTDQVWAQSYDPDYAVNGIPLDEKTNLSPTEVWKQIAGKAHLYQTAKLGTRYVEILRVVCDGTFSIYHPVFGEMHVGCHELTDFCL